MTDTFDPNLIQLIRRSGVVAVLVIENESDAGSVAKALQDGGITALELTLRTPAAWAALERIKNSVPQMEVGVGTVLTPEQVREAVARGASFGVSPGVNRRVLEAAIEAGLSFAPGVATPTDIETALEYRCKLLKFFPAGPSGGMPFLKAISAPYAHLGLEFIPLGGLNAKTIPDYISDPMVAALGGSWLAPRDIIAAGNWNQITALARETVQIITSIRGI